MYEISIFFLLFTPQTVTLYNKPKYDKCREICLLSLVNTTNIYFGGQKTLTVPQSAGQSEFAVPQSAGQQEYTSPLSESNYLDSIL